MLTEKQKRAFRKAQQYQRAADKGVAHKFAYEGWQGAAKKECKDESLPQRRVCVRPHARAGRPVRQYARRR